MALAWDRVHARYDLMMDVLQRVVWTGDPLVVERSRDSIEEVFGDFSGFLLHLQQRWYTALRARLDAAMEEAGGIEDVAVFQRVQADLQAVDPAVWAVMRAYAAHPALRAGEIRQQRLLGNARTAEDGQACAS